MERKEKDKDRVCLTEKLLPALLYPEVIGWLRQSLGITAAIESEAKPHCIPENENDVALEEGGAESPGHLFPISVPPCLQSGLAL